MGVPLKDNYKISAFCGLFKVYSAVKNELSMFGARVATDIYKYKYTHILRLFTDYFIYIQTPVLYRLGRECELTPPYLKLQDAWADPQNKVGNATKLSTKSLCSLYTHLFN